MENKCKRFLSLLLALVMVLGMFPMGHAHAEEAAKFKVAEAEPCTDLGLVNVGDSAEFVIVGGKAQGRTLGVLNDSNNGQHVTSQDGNKTGIELMNVAVSSINSEEYPNAFWIITKVEGGYTLKNQNGTYVSVKNNNYVELVEENTIQIRRSTNGSYADYWEILNDGPHYLNYFDSFGNATSTGWAASSWQANGPGSQWEIYKVVETTMDEVDPWGKRFWTKVSVDTETLNGGPTEGEFEKAWDNNPSTHWHSNWSGATDVLTGENTFSGVIDFGQVHHINQFSFTPRTDVDSGQVTKASLYVKENEGDEWIPVAEHATFAANRDKKTFCFEAQNVQFVKFVAEDSQAPDNEPTKKWVAVSEFDLNLDETHSFSSVVTDPTCGADGYTTHSCSCGYSYTTPGESATGNHTWFNEYDGTCDVCGETREVIEFTSEKLSGLTGEASAYDANEGAIVDNAFDGNIDAGNYWCTPAGGKVADCWLIANLGGEYLINKVEYTKRIYNGSYECTGNLLDYIIEVRVGDGEWQRVASGDTVNGTTVIEFTPVAATQVKLTATKSYHWQSPNTVMTAAEFAVYQAVCVEHTHAEAVKENEVPATCTEAGSYESVVYCSVCDKVISRKTVTVDPLSHKDEDGDFVCDVCKEALCTEHEEEIIPGKAATCTEAGLTDGVKCSICGYIITAQQEIPAAGHKEEIVPGKDPTCTETGLTDGTKCSVCGEILQAQEEIPATGHQNTTTTPGVLPTLTTPGKTEEVYCNDCETVITPSTVIPALTAKNAKVLNGSNVLALANCEYVLGGTEGAYSLVHAGTYYVQPAANGAKIPQSTNVFTNLNLVAGADGTVRINSGSGASYNGGIHFHTEANKPYWNKCNSYDDHTAKHDLYLFKADANSTNTEIPGYTMVSFADITVGDSYLIAAKNHQGNWFVMAPAASSNEFDHIAQIVTDAVNHTHEYTTTTQAATCIATGLITNRCDCGHIHTEVIPVNEDAHTVVTDAAVAPTCTTTGLTEGSHCSACNEVIVAQEIVGKLPHTVVTDEAVEPTCTENGLTEGSHCDVCKTVIIPQEVIPAAHTRITHIPENYATCTTAGNKEYWYCFACGNAWLDEELTQETTVDDVVVDALGHYYMPLGAVPPTCEEEGYTVFECQDCGNKIVGDYVAAMGHQPADPVRENVVEPTLNSKGSYDSVVYCSVCNFEMSRTPVEVPALSGAAAEVGGVKYATFEEALAAAKAGDDKVITLLKEVTVKADTTYDLDGVQVISDGDAFVVTGGTLTLNGNGYVEGGHSGVGSWTAVWADGGKVIINGGTYTVGGDTNTPGTHQNDVIYTKAGGTVEIYGGLFLNDGTVWTLNQNDETGGKITVYGGTFQGWNPANNVSEGKNTNFVAEGYCAADDGEGNFTVQAHDYESVVTAPTCTEKGYTTYTCYYCGDSYVADEVDAKGHRYSSVVTTPATCTEAGYVTITCGDCGKVFVSGVDAEADQYLIDYPFFNLDPKGHTEGEPVEENRVESDLNNAGSYDSVIYCSVCKVELKRETITIPVKDGAAASVNGYKYATFEEALAAAKAGDDKVITLLKEVTVKADTTYDLDGVQVISDGDAFVVTGGTLTLNGNGYVEGGHSGVGSWTAVWANGGKVIINDGTYTVGGDTNTPGNHQNDVIYTKNGGTVEIYGGLFLNDGTVWTLNENDSNRKTITVYGGTFQGWNPADNVSEGKNTNFVAEGYCAADDGEGNFTVQKHSYNSVVTEPTCTEKGYTTYTCEFCDDTYVADEVDAKGHRYSSVVTTPATCTEAGYVTITCGDCGKVFVSGKDAEADQYLIDNPFFNLDPKGHTEEIIPAVAATCTETGLTEGKKCSVCGEILVAQEVVEATGHSGTVNITPATCTENGCAKGVCDICGETFFYEEFPAKGHSEGEAVKENEVAATCTTDGSYDSVVKCTICDAELSRETVVVPAGHNYVNGGWMRKCTGCGDLFDGFYNDILFIEGVLQQAYQLVEYKGAIYFVSDAHKVAKDTTLYLTEAIINGATDLAGNAIKPGYYEFEADGKMVIPDVKEGVIDGYLYIDGVRQNAYQLIEHDGAMYFVYDAHKVAADTRLYLTDQFVEGKCFPGTNRAIKPGYYEFRTDGTMVIPDVKEGVIDGYLYIDDVMQKAYQLIEFEDHIYFVYDCHKIATDCTLYLTSTFADMVDLPVGYYYFNENGWLVLDAE